MHFRAQFSLGESVKQKTHLTSLDLLELNQDLVSRRHSEMDQPHRKLIGSHPKSLRYELTQDKNLNH